MKKDRKKLLNTKYLKIDKYIIIIILLIIIISAFSIPKINTSDKEEDELTYNKNKTFTQEQKLKGIVFKDIKCTYDGKNSIISYKMYNSTNKEIYLQKYIVYVKDKHNITLTKIVANVTTTIKPKEAVEMANQVVDADLTNAHHMELEIDTTKEKAKTKEKSKEKEK